MKKAVLSVFATSLCASLLLASGALADGSGTVGSMKGPTSMGLVHLMQEEETDDDPDFTFTMVTAADELLAKFTGGEVDIALVPANMAGVLYNKTKGNVQVINVNTLGVLYLVTADASVSGVADLKGRTVYTTGKGQTPEYVLRYLMEANGLTEDDVTIEFKSEAAEVVSTLAQDPSAIGVLPQPFATVACQQNEALQQVSDLTQEWNKTGKGSLVTGVTVVKKDFAASNPELIEDFLEEHEESIDFANEHTAEAAALVASYGIIEKAPVAEKALPKCNLTYLDGEEMKTALGGYLEVLFAQEPASVGGALPADDFYYMEAEDDD